MTFGKLIAGAVLLFAAAVLAGALALARAYPRKEKKDEKSFRDS